MTQQLTYGCSDGIPGRAAGGWGVLHRTHDLDPAIEEALIDLVSVDLPATLPDFPSRQQLSGRPVRFRAFPTSDGRRALLTRSLEAGLDHTRRPGNVFTHGALVGRSELVRPLDYWDSPDWLAPFGADQVRIAEPPAALSPPSGCGFSRLAEQFRSDSALMATLPWMADVLMHVVISGRPVCLVEPHQARAAAWFGLVSWAVDERAASGLAVAINEDRRSAAAMLDRGVRLLSVPDPPAASVIAHRAVVIDPTWNIDDTAAAVSGEWSLPHQFAVPRSDWSRLLLDMVWEEPAVVEEALAVRENIAQGLRGLQALPDDPVAQLTIVHLALLAGPRLSALGGALALANRLESLPTFAVNSQPVLRRLAAEVEIQQATTRVATPAQVSINLGARRPSAAGRPTDSDAANVSEIRSPFAASQESAPESDPDDSLITNVPSSWADRGPSESPTTPPAPTREPDALDDFAYPTPRSATRSALILAQSGVDAQTGTASQCGWVGSYLEADPLVRLALLHTAAYACDPVTGECAALLLAVTPIDENFERLAPALLLQVCRSHLLSPPRELQGGATWSALAGYVAQCDARDLAYLALHFGPLLERAESGSARMVRSLAQLAVEPTFSVWGFSTREGRPLVQVVLDEIRRTQLDDSPSVGSGPVR